jgi:hypothetical protein
MKASVSAKGGCEVEGDVARNLIRMSYRGQVGTAITKAAGEKVVLLLPQMRRGFAVLSDLSCLDSMDLDCAADIAKLMDILRVQGIGTVVRIIPDPTKDIGLNILSIVHFRGSVKVVTCQTRAEAERALSRLS